MTSITVTDLFVYPLKSGMGAAIDSATVCGQGVRQDRMLCLAQEEGGALVSAREHPELSAIGCELDGEQLHFTDTASGSQMACTLDDFREPGTVQVWSKACTSLVANAAMNDWFSARLQGRVRLHLRQRDNAGADFFDTAPIHLISRASLHELNRLAPVALPDDIFRANIVVDGLAAQEEKYLAALTINGIEFEVLDACDRCSMPDALMRYQGGAPVVLDSLARHSTDGRLAFGVYLQAMAPGVIRRGDAVGITHRF